MYLSFRVTRHLFLWILTQNEIYPSSATPSLEKRPLEAAVDSGWGQAQLCAAQDAGPWAIRHGVPRCPRRPLPVSCGCRFLNVRHGYGASFRTVIIATH